MKPAQQALQAYQEGRLEDAGARARAIIDESPDNTNARQVLAMVLNDQGQPQDAAQILSDGLKPGQNAPGAWNLLISLHLSTGDVAKAQAALVQAGSLVQQNTVLGRAACLVHCASGAFAEARQDFEHVLALPSTTADVATDCLKALSSKLNRFKVDDMVPAIIERWPDHDPLRWAAVEVAGNAKEYRLALELLKPFLSQENPEAIRAQVLSLLELNQPEQAEQAARRGLGIVPDSVTLMVQLGRALRIQGKFEAALDWLDQAYQRDPKAVGIYIEHGHIFTMWGRRDEAAAWLERGSKVSDHPGLANNLSLELLSRGDFERGFALYEARLDPELGLGNHSLIDLPVWQGEDLTDKTLVVWGEQALGEQILHFQAMKPLLERPDVTPQQVTFICDRRLIPIFKRSAPALTYLEKQEFVAGNPEAKAPGDYTIAVGSLHHLLGADVVRHYGNAPYLSADPSLRDDLREKYEKLAAGRPIIGVAWGSVNPSWGPDKTILPEVFGSALSGTGCFFVNLQYAPTEEGLARVRGPLTDSEQLFYDEEVDSITELESFFAQVAACDAIATISNSTAHVAGAQGVPGEILVPRGRGALWYWFQSDEIPGWYPSLTIHRQTIAREWAETLTALKVRLMQKSALTRQPDVKKTGELTQDLNAAEQKHAQGDLMAAWALCAPHVSHDQAPFEVLRLAGILQMKLGQIDLGLAYLTRAAAQQDDDPNVWFFIARGYYEKHNLGSALKALEKAKTFDVNRALYHGQLADIRSAQGKSEDALEQFALAAEVSEHPGARLNLALALLRSRQFQEGFELYECRFENELHPDIVPPESLPTWDGGPLDGKRLLIVGEQGLGDMILNVQAITGLLARGDVSQAQISISCDQRLHDVLGRAWPNITLVTPDLISASDARLSGFADVTVSLPSLHRILGPEVWRSYGQQPYLFPPPELTETFRSSYRTQSGGRPVIGVSWLSSNLQSGPTKSVPLHTMAEVFWGIDVWCLSLDQTPPAPEQIEHVQAAFQDVPFHVDETVDPERDFDSQLAQIAACDIIVTVSNTVAHAAGAMGKSVILLLPKHKSRYWYWFDEPQKGLWYPHVTALIQRAAGNWSWPITAAKHHLAQFLK